MRKKYSNIRNIKTKIGIVRFPPDSSGIGQLRNLVDVIAPIVDELFIISNNKFLKNQKLEKNIKTFRVEFISGNTIFIRSINRLAVQMKMAMIIFRQKNVKFWIAYGDFDIALPILFSKILNKKVAIIPMGSSKEIIKNTKGYLMSAIAELFINYLFKICDLLILYSENLISEFRLEKFRNKIFFAHKHLIDFSKFNITIPVRRREDIVGYVGRFSNEKNVLSFLYSVSIILDKIENLNFLLIGDGIQKEEVIEYIRKNNLENKVDNIGWISKDDLPNYLNKMKLLVIPSKTEGLPNIMLEAMACGTPVLASRVGSIPDILKNGDNGFLLENTNPECIAENIIKIINSEILNMITENANNYVRENFDIKKTREVFMKLIYSNLN